MDSDDEAPQLVEALPAIPSVGTKSFANEEPVSQFFVIGGTLLLTLDLDLDRMSKFPSLSLLDT